MDVKSFKDQHLSQRDSYNLLKAEKLDENISLVIYTLTEQMKK